MGFTVIDPNNVPNLHEPIGLPGEYRSLTSALQATQLAAAIVRVPARTDFEQGTGHHHDAIEEIYIIVRGTLTMKIGDQVLQLDAPKVVRVDPRTVRGHRNEGDREVLMFVVSPNLGRDDATKVPGFWDQSS